MIYPKKLKTGDEIRVVAPSQSGALLEKNEIEETEEILRGYGLKVSYSKNCFKKNSKNSSTVEERIDDLNEAFADKNVKMIVAAKGGYTAIEILQKVDYEVIRKNPKILVGYSDITNLSLAIYAKTGLITYSGCNFTGISDKEGQNYNLEYWRKAFLEKQNPGKQKKHKNKIETGLEVETNLKINNFENILKSDYYFDVRYTEKGKVKNKIKNEGLEVLNNGEAEGEIIGGNFGVFCSLFGTEFLPKLENKILFLEEFFTSDLFDFNQHLESLSMQKGFDKVKAIVFGRFQSQSGISNKIAKELILSKEKFSKIPIIIGADMGHTEPRFTFPVGGAAKINTKNKNIIKIFFN